MKSRSMASRGAVVLVAALVLLAARSPAVPASGEHGGRERVPLSVPSDGQGGSAQAGPTGCNEKLPIWIDNSEEKKLFRQFFFELIDFQKVFSLLHWF